MIRFINALMNSLVGGFLSLFRAAGPWPALWAVSLVTAVAALWVIRLASNQEKLRRAKGRQTARLLEFLLYRDDPVVSFGAFGRTLAAAGAYQKELLKPLAVMLVPLVLLLIQLAGWFDARPLRPGEQALVKVRFGDAAPVDTIPVALAASDGLAVETEAFRIPEDHEIDWRIRAAETGPQEVEVRADSETLTKHVRVAAGFAQAASRRVRGGWWNRLTHPAEPPLPAAGPVESIEITYPSWADTSPLLAMHWIVWYFLLSLVFGLLLKRPLGVEF